MRIFWDFLATIALISAVTSASNAGSDVWTFDQENYAQDNLENITATNRSANYTSVIGHRLQTNDWIFLNIFPGKIPIEKLYVFPHDSDGNGKWYSFPRGNYTVRYENQSTIVALEITENFLSILQGAHAIQFFSDDVRVIVSLKGSRGAIDEIRSHVRKIRSRDNGFADDEIALEQMEEALSGPLLHYMFQCARLASHPYDLQMPNYAEGGVKWQDLDTEPALRACRKVEESSNYVSPNLNYNLGRILVKMQNPDAVRYLVAAEKEGYIAAIFQLGILYENGRMVEKNASKALERYLIGAKASHLPSLYHAGLLLIDEFNVEFTEFENAVGMVKKASELGFGSASRRMGIWHLDGAFGDDGSAATARKYFLRGRKQDNADSAYRLSHMYRDGVGGPVNEFDYIDMLKQAISMGHVEARKEHDRF